ncbi:folylpolyglutamate synthase/dihydrofolate synthase family protein [Porphyrobacter sp. YT40]|uniref:bifunctional folylpolyglutamate synthase/dihydrofolate synthase n=1 Tax=Porphyrobacter sp. YT40 TaxID=2547601 RepID=UPI0011413E81|nr:folylpolyglutamate synthase/dihydrofolate synthase family protein [Porphyrobacter sp. YT40]QDH34619.1 bifunctional folylpolyglutamate synthase/dihydrofolate synthase [Porphyrobacter sp. YT40]
MRDFGKSDDPRVQAQLDRLAALSLPQGRLGLDTIGALMERLDNPHRKLPPVFHVAGTNGKGSTCAFLRAMLEAEGYQVHVTTSPHLVRYNERIRLAGELISDAMLADVLAEVLDAGEDLGPSFFEVTIAAAFLAFSRVPADACVVEVGMGGRFDATNVLEPEVLAACGIAALGFDHERFLLAPEEGVPTEPMARIAFEKAGIAKRGVPLVTMGDRYLPQSRATIERTAAIVGAPLFPCGLYGAWAAKTDGGDGRLIYGEGQACYFHAPLGLTGRHQVDNAGLAVAMLRFQEKVRVSEEAMKAGLAAARWPARMQRLSSGPLTGTRDVWLDGGHNPDAGQAIASFFGAGTPDLANPLRRLHLVIGMIEGKNPASLIDPLGGSIATITAVPVPGHDWHPASAFGPAARSAPDVPSALAMIPEDGLPILIAGSLYLAGEVLRLNDELPD